MTLALLLLLAAAGPKFEATDARDKKPSGVTIEAGAPDENGWMDLKITGKPKTQPVLVWPYDGKAKLPDGPGGITTIVIERGDLKALTNPRVVAALLAAELLGKPVDAGLHVSSAPLQKADDYFAKGVGLLYDKKVAEAAEPLSRALRERERLLTRIPSDIYPTAVLAGRALLGAARYNEAAVAFLKALNHRPDDPDATSGRAEALILAGKAEAAKQLLEKP
ncbi:MAG: hypothetical protein JWN34_1151 [Bryobacterales bacterium]|nr:hypothetical protein [Bryobacterales bacterium]